MVFMLQINELQGPIRCCVGFVHLNNQSLVYADYYYLKSSKFWPYFVSIQICHWQTKTNISTQGKTISVPNVSIEGLPANWSN